MSTISIIGRGAWGQALATILAVKNPLLCGRDEERAAGEADIVLLAVPAQTIGSLMVDLQPCLKPDARLVICAKGIELGTGRTLDRVVRGQATDHTIAILSGPNFAGEIAAGKPAAATLASADEKTATELAAALSTPVFRLYHSRDVTGVAIGGALKNVIAIACGIVIGKGLGENARAALMTRGLAEMTRLAVRLGGKAETLMGLSGLGDLALTASSFQSRNFSFGVRLGQGEAIANAAHGTLIEGAATAGAALKLAAAQSVELPITAAVSTILGGADIDQIFENLMDRPQKNEHYRS